MSAALHRRIETLTRANTPSIEEGTTPLSFPRISFASLVPLWKVNEWLSDLSLLFVVVILIVG